MILVDSSVWIDHFRRGNAKLRSVLESEQVLMHQVVLGELACGNLARRKETLHLLRQLPQAMPADADEVLALIEKHRLMGSGLGWSDVNLLASAVLDGSALWTLDRRMADAAVSLGVAAKR